MNYLISKEWSVDTIYYFYKTTNLVTGKFYYGSGYKKNYIGSGSDLLKDIIEYGDDNFQHERLRFFRTRQNAYDFEERFLHFIDAENIPNCYNLHNYASGGKKGQCAGMINVIDCEGNIFKVEPSDNRLETGLVKPYTTRGYVAIRLANGETKQIKCDDFHKFPNAEYINKGKVLLKNKDGKIDLYDTNDERYLSGELVHVTTNMVSVKHYKTGKTMLMSKNDERYLSGEYVGVQKGCLVWNKKITINNIEDTVKNWAYKFKVKVGDLRSYLEKENINWV